MGASAPGCGDLKKTNRRPWARLAPWSPEGGQRRGHIGIHPHHHQVVCRTIGVGPVRCVRSSGIGAVRASFSLMGDLALAGLRVREGPGTSAGAWGQGLGASSSVG